jgi:hypothetical protein
MRRLVIISPSSTRESILVRRSQGLAQLILDFEDGKLGSRQLSSHMRSSAWDDHSCTTRGAIISGQDGKYVLRPASSVADPSGGVLKEHEGVA